MNRFFDRFQELELVKELKVVETPKVTGVITFEHPLIYRVVNLEDRILYRSLSRRLKNSWKKRKRIWKKEGYKSENEELSRLRCESEELEEIKSKISLTVEPLHNQINNLIVKGVLDYTADDDYYTWDERKIPGCMRFLTTQMLEALEEYDNDDIEKIIVFSGLHANEHPFAAASRIVAERGFEPGIVKVYSTISWYDRPPITNPNVEVLHRERRHLCSELMRFNFAEDIVNIYNCGGETIKELRHTINGIK